MEKLDTFSKILLATQTINYMASSVNSSVLQLKGSKAIDPSTELSDEIKDVLKQTIDRNSQQLDTCFESLVKTMEELGNYMNNVDLICPIDVRITEEAFQILLHGKDHVEK